MAVSAALVSLASALRAAAGRRIFSLGRRVEGGPLVLMVEVVDEAEAQAVHRALTGRPGRGDWRQW